MSEELIGRFDMEMESPSCTPGASWWGIKIHLDDDISGVFPYLNAELDGVDYRHKAKVLLWDSDKGFRCAFRSNEIAIAPIESRDIAQELCDEIIGMVCDTWSRHHEIEPDYTGKAPPPSMLQLLKLLPRTNCKDCGCPTCMAFAAELIRKSAELAQCDHLSVENRNKLSRLIME